jgi:hypothetical protein
VSDIAQYYRMYATVAADMAAETTDPVRRETLLEIAQAGQRLLAEKAEQSQPIDGTGLFPTLVAGFEKRSGRF